MPNGSGFIKEKWIYYEMGTRIKISALNQTIDVRLRQSVKQPDGSVKSNWDTQRFITKAEITQASNNQGYKDGLSESEAYYKIKYRYHPDRKIQISDQILWDGKVLKPVGSCEPFLMGNKRFLLQRVKYTANA